MNKYKLRVLLNPRWWIRNYGTDKDADAFFRYLIDHKSEVKVKIVDEYRLSITFRCRVYYIWRANFPYAYLQTVETHSKDGLISSENILPSRATALEFYETFDREIEPQTAARSILNLVIQPEKIDVDHQ